MDNLEANFVWYKYNENTTTSKIRMKIIDRQDLGQNYYKDLITQGGGTALVKTAFTSSSSTIQLNTSALGFPATGYLRIKSINGYEIIQYTSVSSISGGYEFSGLTRGVFNTSVLENVTVNTPVQDYSDVASKSNSTILSDIQTRGENFAASYFSTNREKANFKVTIEGAKIRPNEFVELTIQDVGINQALARVKDVSHNIQRTSWTTELNMEEDDTRIE